MEGRMARKGSTDGKALHRGKVALVLESSTTPQMVKMNFTASIFFSIYPCFCVLK